MQNFVYKQNLRAKNQYISEKEKYAKMLEDKHFVSHLSQERQPLLPLGKTNSQMEMTNAQSRQYLKEMLELQLREKNLPSRFTDPYSRNQAMENDRLVAESQ